MSTLGSSSDISRDKQWIDPPALYNFSNTCTVILVPGLGTDWQIGGHAGPDRRSSVILS